jgi:hypothetical protein
VAVAVRCCGPRGRGRTTAPPRRSRPAPPSGGPPGRGRHPRCGPPGAPRGGRRWRHRRRPTGQPPSWRWRCPAAGSRPAPHRNGQRNRTWDGSRSPACSATSLLPCSRSGSPPRRRRRRGPWSRAPPQRPTPELWPRPEPGAARRALPRRCPGTSARSWRLTPPRRTARAGPAGRPCPPRTPRRRPASPPPGTTTGPDHGPGPAARRTAPPPRTRRPGPSVQRFPPEDAARHARRPARRRWSPEPAPRP